MKDRGRRTAKIAREPSRFYAEGEIKIPSGLASDTNLTASVIYQLNHFSGTTMMSLLWT